jgi:hypothetical protein
MNKEAAKEKNPINLLHKRKGSRRTERSLLKTFLKE